MSVALVISLAEYAVIFQVTQDLPAMHRIGI